MLEEKLHNLFLKYPEVIYGYTDISYSPYSKDYKSALVFAVPHKRQLTINDYRESEFELGIAKARFELEQIVTQIETLLKEERVSYYIPSVAQKNEEELLAEFSFKFAAVNAGLGWIGKNDVIITKQYGPRVRLSAVLIDEVFSYGQKYTKSECPEDCRKCVDICPHKALSGTTWDISTMRSDIINYHLCNQKRSEFIKLHGRKNACGLCLAVCPYGINLT